MAQILGLIVLGILAGTLAATLGIGGGVKLDPLPFELFAKVPGIDNITVVRHRDFVVAMADNDGLNIADAIGAGGGIAVMSDGQVAGKTGKNILAEYL